MSVTVSNEDRFSELHKVAKWAATQVWPAHRAYTTVGDLTQEGILWLLSKQGQKRVDNHTFDDGELHARGLMLDVVNSALLPYVRKERREALRGADDDTHTYSEKALEAVLPAVFDPTYRPAAQAQERVSGTNDPASGNNWGALVVDVKRAVDAVCADDDRRILFARSVGGWTWAKFGETYSLSGEWHRLRYHDCLARMAAFLNGGVKVADEDSFDGKVTGGVLRRRPDKVVDV